MTTANQSRRSPSPTKRPALPPIGAEPLIHGDVATIRRWLLYYAQKLALPTSELLLLAITQDRQEYMLWTARRLNTMALGCYCYISTRVKGTQHRHLIFIEPELQPQSIEVTVAHELIHMADRVNGTPRRHRHHGYDSIAADEAALTGYDLDELRRLLHEESQRRDAIRRQRRPLRYMYACSHCGKTYPRARRYSQSVSCSSCDKHYNPVFKLALLPAVEPDDQAKMVSD
ncbi:hypothetical protein [Tengunoibacter tsumagoiensis]|uniref:SprT-like domain-containing protein n=1 Tax=Tengunoibacter tsumagoiensis TaxID=2014871 RepID=A0A401ZV34_9CHLR|nr:hypothetical protein [Tengunoibacter tsumagoiensis]GCE10662.1 hypothetical protein KTT_05210 [Tengunoibacter tsumagoiensis]